MRSGSKQRRERGASLVEFALILPVFAALIFGMLTGGLALSAKNSMQNAVREGSRFGATIEEGTNWASQVEARVVELAAGDLTASQVCVELIRRETSGETTKRANSCSLPASAEPSSASVPVGSCAVKVWAQRTAEFDFVLASPDLTLDAASINQYERTGTPVACS